MKRDIYQEVTDRIIASLEAGTVPWQKPWRNIGGELPRNVRTGTKYRGINVFLLAIQSLIEGYTDPRWGTYKAITEQGGQVRKGETGTRIILWKRVEKKTLNENGDKDSYSFLTSYVVFNVEQADGIEPLEREPLPEHERLAAADAILDGYVSPELRKIGKEFVAGPRRREGGNSAHWEPEADRIVTPLLGQFEDADAYYGTAFHELVHSTGHESRLARFESAVFDSDPYAKEELVAELGAAMLSAVVGIDSRESASAAYIEHWLGRLKADPKLVIQSAAKAQKAADLVLGTTFDAEPENSTKEAGSATKADLALAS